MARLVAINMLPMVTCQVVEAARESLVVQGRLDNTPTRTNV